MHLAIKAGVVQPAAVPAIDNPPAQKRLPIFGGNPAQLQPSRVVALIHIGFERVGGDVAVVFKPAR